jgi:ketosteroid isomerase-like protein
MLDLATLEDERAIRQVYCRYCDIIDRKEFGRLDEVFTEDCVGDYRSTNGQVMKGLAPLVAHVTRGMGPGSDCGATHHNCCNFRIEVSGDTARAIAHFYAVHEGINRCAGEHYTCWGEYDDQFVRTGKGWRVARRTYRNFLIDGTVDVVRATRT